MQVNLDELVVNAPKSPIKEWDNGGIHWEDYEAKAFYHGILAARIVVARAASEYRRQGPWSDSFFFDLSQALPVPKPWVDWQGTEEQFRGNGINGHLICCANESYRGKLGTPLYSSDHFLIHGGQSAKRVWQKLVEAGLAVYCPEIGKDRWRML